MLMIVGGIVLKRLLLGGLDKNEGLLRIQHGVRLSEFFS